MIPRDVETAATDNATCFNSALNLVIMNKLEGQKNKNKQLRRGRGRWTHLVRGSLELGGGVVGRKMEIVNDVPGN